MSLKVTKENFAAEVLNSQVPVILDFWAPWCGPCKVLGPIIDELAVENNGKSVKIAKINVDENAELATQYGVRGIPCVMVFKSGNVINEMRVTGLQSKQTYQDLINRLT